MPTSQRLRQIVGVAFVPAVLAIVGSTHPARLNDASANHWLTMHIIALPVFPLLALSPWLIARLILPQLGVVVAVLGYVYAAFYTALDVLAGIGAGLLQINDKGVGKFTLYQMADRLAVVGLWAFLIASALVIAACLIQARLLAVPGAVLVAFGAVMFFDNHIYWPRGVIAMAALALGYAALAWAMTTVWSRTDSPVRYWVRRSESIPDAA